MPLNRILRRLRTRERAQVGVREAVDLLLTRLIAYANNHYAGHAPATIEQFRNLWYAKGLPELDKGRRYRQESSLFDS